MDKTARERQGERESNRDQGNEREPVFVYEPENIAEDERGRKNLSLTILFLFFFSCSRVYRVGSEGVFKDGSQDPFSERYSFLQYFLRETER